MNSIFSRGRSKKKRLASANDARPARNEIYYLGPKRRSSQDTLVYNRFDSTQENYGQLADNLSAVNRSINTVVRDVLNGEYTALRHSRRASSHHYNNDSDDTVASIDSLEIDGFKIFGKSLNEYNSKRNMPLISIALKSGQLIFPSEQSVNHFKKSHKWRLTGSIDRCSSSNSGISGTQLNDMTRSPTRTRPVVERSQSYDSSAIIDDEDDEETDEQYEEDSDLPLFHISVPPLAQFRKKCPYLIISKYYVASELRERALNDPTLVDAPIKYTFCKVFDKYIKTGVKRFKLEFFPDPKQPNESFTVIMFTHRSKPYTDTIYKGTKLRFVGTSVCTSVFGSSSIQLMVMNESGARSLMDDLTEDEKPCPNNPLLKEETTLSDISGSIINSKLYGNSTLPPLAKFQDAYGDALPRKVQTLGEIFCYESMNLLDRNDLYGDFNNVKQVKLDTMVITCMLLVLREQENKKNPRTMGTQFTRGTPYYGSPAGVYGASNATFPLGGMF